MKMKMKMKTKDSSPIPSYPPEMIERCPPGPIVVALAFDGAVSVRGKPGDLVTTERVRSIYERVPTFYSNGNRVRVSRIGDD